MKLHHLKIVLFSFLVVAIVGCKSEINSPDRANADAAELLKFETVESDLALLKGGGMPLPEGDAVFSIGWNEMFRPFDDDSSIKGMAFAVAFGDRITESPDFPRFGIDMGTINIEYAGNQIEMHKIFHQRRGTAYSLFRRPFGGSEVLLEYLPSTEYTFNISGSERFARRQLLYYRRQRLLILQVIITAILLFLNRILQLLGMVAILMEKLQ